MKKKPILIVLGLVLVFLVVTYLPTHLDFIDQNGWVHKRDQTTPNMQTNATETEYKLVSASKSDYTDISAHSFIKKVSSVLDAYQDKTYVTFMFEDGTGLYCPGSSLDYVLVYGKVNEIGAPEEELSYITVTGNTVTQEDVPYFLTKESYEVSSIIPEKYQNDSTWSSVKDNIAYFQVANIGDVDEMTIAKEIFNRIPDPDIYQEIHIVVDLVAYKWTPETELQVTDYTSDFIY